MRRRWGAYFEEAIAPRIALLRYLRRVSSGVLALQVCLNLSLGALPVLFVAATSTLIGRAPAAVASGVDSPQWSALVASFFVASAVFAAQQLIAPTHVAVSKRIKHQVDGYVFGRLIDLSLRSTGIGSLEDPGNRDSLHTAVETLETGFRTPGEAAAGMLELGDGTR